MPRSPFELQHVARATKAEFQRVLSAATSYRRTLCPAVPPPLAELAVAATQTHPAAVRFCMVQGVNRVPPPRVAPLSDP